MTELDLYGDEVLVTDVRRDHVVFDVLRARVDLAGVAGRQDALLRALRSVDGVRLATDAGVHSHGVLGVLGAPGDQVGGVVADDEQAVAGRQARLGQAGRGLVVTTGGAGAEDKDRTVEALPLLDPEAATAVLTYEPDHGRHSKADVRVAVVRVESTTLVAVPGPTREARAGLAVLVGGLTAKDPGPVLAERIAESIRPLWPSTHRIEEGV